MLKNLFKNNKVITVLFIALLVGISLYYAFLRTKQLDYIAINGDFQNYNIFRRILNGQFMFKDFSNYLGLGIVLLNLPFLIFSNNLFTSMFVTTFTSYMCFFIMGYFLVSLIFKNKKNFSMLITIILIISIELLQYINRLFPLYNFYKKLPGNSMRIERAFLPIVICFIFFSFQKKSLENKNILINKNIFILGIISGSLMLWSNDYGFSAIISEFVILIILFIKNKIKFIVCIKKIFYFIISSFCSFIFAAFIVSGGDLISYFNMTFGTLDYQYWYYGNVSDKVGTITSIFDSLMLVIFLVLSIIIFIVNLIKLIKDKYNIKDIGVVFILLTNLIAMAMYIYGSGGYNIDTYIYITSVIIIAYLIKIIFKHFKIKENIINNITLITFIIIVIILDYKFIKYIDSTKYINFAYKYDEVLKGKILYKDELEEIYEVTKGKKVFSLYASAYEAKYNLYQPTKYDYIIHVLGDKSRKEYIEKFNSGKYKYVLTIEPDYTIYTSWIKHANWFFYKELYANYKPMKKVGYNIIWKRTENPNIPLVNINVKYKKIGESTYKIYTDDLVSDNIIVDLKINYEVKRKKELCALNVFKTSAVVFDNSGYDESNYKRNTYYLKGGKNEYNIPLVVNNENSSLIINASQPCTTINIKNIEIEGVYYNYDKTNDTSDIQYSLE